jgi:hypothetical protein
MVHKKTWDAMTHLLSLDPGLNSGVALGWYSPITPYQLLDRWQVHNGLPGFVQWWENERPDYDELVVEKFILSGSNDFTADLTPVEIEGALRVLLGDEYENVMWQPRQDKGLLCGYPTDAKTPDQRQRVRFDFLDRFGLYVPGEDNIDSMDAICHALVSLKRRKHMPTMRKYWRDN